MSDFVMDGLAKVGSALAPMARIGEGQLGQAVAVAQACILRAAMELLTHVEAELAARGLAVVDQAAAEVGGAAAGGGSGAAVEAEATGVLTSLPPSDVGLAALAVDKANAEAAGQSEGGPTAQTILGTADSTQLGTAL